ncbi:MAG: hypothetical protein ACYDHG_04300 [Desulfomonilaceae bacterium]
MDEEPFIIAAMMAAEEQRRREKKAAEKRKKRLVDAYQPLQYDQPGGVSRLGWIIFGIIIVVIYLISRLWRKKLFLFADYRHLHVRDHRLIWKDFCERHKIRESAALLFEISRNGVVLTKQIGKSNPRAVLRGSDATEYDSMGRLFCGRKSLEKLSSV